MADWTPAFPDFARPSEGPLNDRPDDTGSAEWADAPAGSHVEKFRYFDARASSFLRKFGQGNDGRAGGMSELHVRFRPAGARGTTEYAYFFADPEKGAKVFAALREADHPGEVVHADLITARVPYRRLA